MLDSSYMGSVIASKLLINYVISHCNNQVIDHSEDWRVIGVK